MRENVNASFTPYEWLPIKKHMDKLGLNRYEFFRYCILKECGVILDRNTTKKDEKPNSGREKSGIGEKNVGDVEPFNDIDE